MNKEVYLNHFHGTMHGNIEIVSNMGEIILQGTGVFIPSDTRLYAYFSVVDHEPLTIDKYCVLFRPYDRNYVLIPVAVYDRLLVDGFHSLTRQYDMTMLLKSNNYDAMLEFIKDGAAEVNIAILSQRPNRVAPENHIIKRTPIHGRRLYNDKCSIAVFMLVNQFTGRTNNLITITNPVSFISVQTIHELLNAVKLYWYLYHIERRRLQIASMSFRTKNGKELQLLCTKEQTVSNGRINTLPTPTSPGISTRRLHKILSTYLLNNSPRCRGLRYAADEFLRLATNQSEAYGINDYIRQPILVLDSLITNIKRPSRKRTPRQKQKDKQSIQTVLDFIENNKSSLSNNVYEFYSSKTVEQIIGLMYRPPFKQKITDVLDWLKISYSDFELNLDDVSKIRNQVVHGQNYDVNYLLDKSITRNVQHVDKKSGMTTVSLSMQAGIVDTTLKIIRDIFAAYFDMRCSYK